MELEDILTLLISTKLRFERRTICRFGQRLHSLANAIEGGDSEWQARSGV